jgi:hypothetical protein
MTNVVVVQSITKANNRLNIFTAPDVVTGRADEIAEQFGETRCGDASSRPSWVRFVLCLTLSRQHQINDRVQRLKTMPMIAVCDR